MDHQIKTIDHRLHKAGNLQLLHKTGEIQVMVTVLTEDD